MNTEQENPNDVALINTLRKLQKSVFLLEFNAGRKTEAFFAFQGGSLLVEIPLDVDCIFRSHILSHDSSYVGDTKVLNYLSGVLSSTDFSEKKKLDILDDFKLWSSTGYPTIE